jgi:hypothetical protein
MTDSKHDPADSPESGRGPNVGSNAHRDRGVLDPAWEDELRRGQEAEGEAGSVEDELAYLHLLRHTREPEALAGDQLDALWSAIEADLGSDGAVAGTPWWRKAWIWWSAPALAAAAVLVVVIVKPSAEDQATSVARNEEAPAMQTAKSAPAPSMASRDESPRELAAEASPAPPSEEAKADAQVAEAEEEAVADGMVGRGGGGEGRARASASPSPFELSFAKLAPHGRVAIRASVDSSRDELRSQLLAKARGGG